MHKGLNLVISNEVRDLAFSATYEEKISRLRLEMTIPAQSEAGEGNLIAESPERMVHLSRWRVEANFYCRSKVKISRAGLISRRLL